MYGWTDDPVRDADTYDRECESSYSQWIDRSPICCVCEQPVARVSETYYDFDGMAVCAKCIGKRITVRTPRAKCSYCGATLYDDLYEYNALEDAKGNLLCEDCEYDAQKEYDG